jgi:hypothetical protein
MAMHKVSSMTGALLDAAVAKASGRSFTLEGFGKLAQLAPQCWTDDGEFDEERGDRCALFSPSTSWADGGPIIERERIESRTTADGWEASTVALHDWSIEGATLLVAAMRAYVASRFGDEVEL